MKNLLLSRRRSARAMYESHAGPNMTPMVDVVMVILIFFMASAVVLGPEWFIATRLPKADSVAPQTRTTPSPRVIVSLTRESNATRLRVNDQPASSQQLLATIASITQDRTADAIILVQPAADVPYEDVVRIHAEISQAGYRKVGLGA
jgi:biopolymer transport protein ExbD